MPEWFTTCTEEILGVRSTSPYHFRLQKPSTAVFRPLSLTSSIVVASFCDHSSKRLKIVSKLKETSFSIQFIPELIENVSRKWNGAETIVIGHMPVYLSRTMRYVSRGAAYRDSSYHRRFEASHPSISPATLQNMSAKREPSKHGHSYWSIMLDSLYVR